MPIYLICAYSRGMFVLDLACATALNTVWIVLSKTTTGTAAPVRGSQLCGFGTVCVRSCLVTSPFVFEPLEIQRHKISMQMDPEVSPGFGLGSPPLPVGGTCRSWERPDSACVITTTTPEPAFGAYLYGNISLSTHCGGQRFDGWGGKLFVPSLTSRNQAWYV